MKKITLNTESYLIAGTDHKRFLPFFELEYDEWVIYEDDLPKYYFEIPPDIKSEYEIINWLVTELKVGVALRDLIVELGNKYEKSWDIHPSQNGMEVENSYQTEQVELEILSDDIIDKLKTTSQQGL